MTKEQAIAMLKAKRECIELDTNGNAELCDRNCGECNLNYEQGNMGEQKEALDIAIKALEQQPSDDCISRKRIKQIVSNITAEYDAETIHIDRLMDEIDDMPPVTPTQKWISADGWLPKQGVEVLTCNDHGFIEIQSLEDGYWENQHGDWTDLEDSDIVAWMPLSKPYEEK